MQFSDSVSFKKIQSVQSMPYQHTKLDMAVKIGKAVWVVVSLGNHLQVRKKCFVYARTNLQANLQSLWENEQKQRAKRNGGKTSEVRTSGMNAGC